jgi:hypothetical protein
LDLFRFTQGTFERERDANSRRSFALGEEFEAFMVSKQTQKDEPHSEERRERIAQAAIEEARMVVPGIQALFGFQLIAVFNQRFHDLTAAEQTLHFFALILIAVAIAIIMTPAAYHRLVERGSVSDFFIRLASRLIAAAMLPLIVALCLEVYLVSRMVELPAWLSAATAAGLFAVFATLWFAFPFAMRNRAADE